jgi:hypothetical protein
VRRTRQGQESVKRQKSVSGRRGQSQSPTPLSFRFSFLRVLLLQQAHSRSVPGRVSAFHPIFPLHCIASPLRHHRTTPGGCGWVESEPLGTTNEDRPSPLRQIAAPAVAQFAKPAPGSQPDFWRHVCKKATAIPVLILFQTFDFHTAILTSGCNQSRSGDVGYQFAKGRRERDPLRAPPKEKRKPRGTCVKKTDFHPLRKIRKHTPEREPLPKEPRSIPRNRTRPFFAFFEDSAASFRADFHRRRGMLSRKNRQPKTARTAPQIGTALVPLQRWVSGQGKNSFWHASDG